MPSRTSEFKSCVESARLRLAQAGQLGSNAAEHKQRLLQGKEARQSSRSEFARSAANIANEIQWTMGKLEKLALRTCSMAAVEITTVLISPVFTDPPAGLRSRKTKDPLR